MASTYEPIASQTLSSATTTVTFSNLPQAFTDIVMQIVQVGSLGGQVSVRLNGSSSSIYSGTILRGNASGASSFRRTSQTAFFLENGSSTEPSLASVSLFSYTSTNVYKTLLMQQSDMDISYVNREVGLWQSASAVTSVSFTAASSNGLLSGTTFALYGIKAA